MTTPLEDAPRYTVADYQHWKGDWELWNGIAIAMTPSPFGKHQQALFALVVELTNAIRDQGCDAIALGELDWIVSDDTVVRPDVIVVCGQVPAKHLETPPALVAEILSPSTRANDLTYKRDLYASQGVGTYLIIDPDAERVEQLSLTGPGRYEQRSSVSGLEMTLCGDCAISIEPKKFFGR